MKIACVSKKNRIFAPKNFYGLIVQNMRNNSTCQSILAAAKQLFVQYGYEKTSMNDIAKTAHKAKGSIYYNFKSKLDIFNELLEQEVESMIKELTDTRIYATTSAYNVSERLKYYLSHRMEVLSNSALCRQAMVELYFGKDEELCGKIKELRMYIDRRERLFFSKVCSKGRKINLLPRQVSPDSFAEMMIMVLKSLEVQFFVQDRYAELKKTYDTMLEVLIGNIIASRPSSSYSKTNI